MNKKNINININNYEEFAIDYIEGNLNAETLKAFELFLEQNPNIREEFVGFEDFNFKIEKHKLNNKFELKKSPIEGLSYFEYLAVSNIEKTISAKEKNELENILTQQNEKIDDYKLFSKTKLTNSEIYKFKTNLKKSPIEDLSYFDYLAISNIEGTITNKEKTELDSILKIDATKKDEYKLFAKTILNSEKIVFQNKSSLKKLKIFTLKNIQRTVVSVAALFIVFIGIKFILNNVSQQRTKYFQQSYANIAIKPQNNILAREISKEYLVQDIIKNEQAFQIKNINNNDVQNTDSSEVLTTNKLIVNMDNETSLNRKKICFNCQDLPQINNALQKYSLEYNNKHNLRENLNLASIVNLAFKSFDVMTESNYNMKLAVDKNNKRLEFDIKEKSFAVAY